MLLKNILEGTLGFNDYRPGKTFSSTNEQSRIPAPEEGQVWGGRREERAAVIMDS